MKTKKVKGQEKISLLGPSLIISSDKMFCNAVRQPPERISHLKNQPNRASSPDYLSLVTQIPLFHFSYALALTFLLR